MTCLGNGNLEFIAAEIIRNNNFHSDCFVCDCKIYIHNHRTEAPNMYSNVYRKYCLKDERTSVEIEKKKLFYQFFLFLVREGFKNSSSAN